MDLMKRTPDLTDKSKGIYDARRFEGEALFSTDTETVATLAKVRRLIGAIVIPRGKVAHLPNLVEVSGNVFCDGKLVAPMLETVGGTLWAGESADLSQVPVETLTGLGAANRLELGVITY